ncbi:hypothetical protein UlMin_036474, partial [Ulmus minor]
CDRILSYGKGMRLLNYRRAELKFSDHRPVTATFVADVEVFSPRKLQQALTFTDAEIENEDLITDEGMEVGMSHLILEQVSICLFWKLIRTCCFYLVILLLMKNNNPCSRQVRGTLSTFSDIELIYKPYFVAVLRI